MGLAVMMAVSLSAQNPSGGKNSQKMKAVELNVEDFKSKIYDYTQSPKEWKFNGEMPAVIDFYASWCGPCKMMAPVMDTLAEEFKGRVNVYKVNVETAPEVAGIFRVQSIPTFVFIPKSGAPKLLTGGMGIEMMRSIIEENCLAE